MANRYQELFRLPQLLFSEGCPVIIEVAVIQKDTVFNRVLAQIKLCNLSTKILTACKVCVKAYEPSGREIEGVPDFCYLDLCAAAGAEFGAKTPVYLPNAATRKISVSVINAVFGDGSVWNGEPCEWEQAPEQETIAEHFPDPEMQKQAALEIGKDCVFFPAIRRGLFQCACGTVNLGADRRCRTCGRTFAELIAALDKKLLRIRKMPAFRQKPRNVPPPRKLLNPRALRQSPVRKRWRRSQPSSLRLSACARCLLSC